MDKKGTYLDEDASNCEHGPSCVHSLALCKPCQPLLIRAQAQRVKSAWKQDIALGSMQAISSLISVMAGSSQQVKHPKQPCGYSPKISWKLSLQVGRRVRSWTKEKKSF